MRMRTISAWVLATTLMAFMAGVGVGALVAGQSGEAPRVTKADADRWNQELSNWGRWGKDDQLGTINLITGQKRKAAAALVKDGTSVSLSRDFNTKKEADNPWPAELEMVTGGQFGGAIVDKLCLIFHGFQTTHLDTFSHVSVNGKIYNGFPKEVLTVEKGAEKGDVINLKHGVFTRGVLLDIARLKGVPYLEPGTPIYPQDLEAAERKAGIKVSAGDALFVRTGRWARRAKVGPWDVTKQVAGLDPSCLPWLKQRDVSLLGQDGWSEVVPRTNAGGIHSAITIMGLHLIDNADLEAVGEAAASRRRWEFLLTAAPLPMPRATGSPINPIATF